MARYLSRADLSHIAGKYIDQYYTRFGISKDDPEPIDPERLASSVLGEFGYPPVTIDDVYKEVLEQAENFKKYAQ